MDIDRKARNERRADRIAHVLCCRICWRWLVMGIKDEMTLWPRPKSTAYLKRHGGHLRAFGFAGGGHGA